jgi:two-component system NtrC family response regulator
VSAEIAPSPPAEDRREVLLSVLSEIARAVAESLEVREVFARMAEALRRVISFDGIGISMIECEEIQLYISAGDAKEEHFDRYAFDDVSPRLRPRAAVLRVDDVNRELDPAFRLDREILESPNVPRSLLFAPLLRGETLVGGLWFGSRVLGAYASIDEEILKPIAELTALALEHERLFSAERERRRRREVLEQLVPTLAKALDVRDVFNQVSAITQQVLPHERLTLGLFSEDRRAVRIYAYSGERLPDLPESIPLTDPEVTRAEWDFEIVEDVRLEPDQSSRKCQLLIKHGLRSMLRVPIRLEGAIVGGLTFHSMRPKQYRESDVYIARRVADQVALALSHQRLAEEARRSADARAQKELLEERVQRLTEELETKGGFSRVIGKAKSWRDVLVQATKVALTETTVLLTGESGTGKEVVARAIHRASRRADGAFVALNCAALPDQLLESELFGYERGAFTGATAPKPGRLEQAGGGTLFLDEVGEMSPLVQAKFLRVLQERDYQRLGGTKTLKADVRVIAATNRDLQAAIQRGGFREDLYYRLHVFEIRLPPLRERADDILPLTESFLEAFGRDVGRPAAGVSKEAKELLLAYAWPGNVRELKNAIERATILAEGGLVTGAHLPISVTRSSPAAASGDGASELPTGGVDLEEMERSYVVRALRQAGNNKSRAAKLLGLTRAQLYTRIEKYGLS